MREYKIVEMKDGHGNPKFQVKAKYGWGIFSIWEKYDQQVGSMQQAQSVVEEAMKDYKSGQRIKVKEYVYAQVPSHVPTEQVGKFMEINQEKK
jgi:hypothetical protein